MARRRSGKKIDFVHWVRVAGSSFAQAAGSVGINLSVAQHEPETLLRMRGSILSFVDAAPAPGAAVSVGVGVCLVPEGTGTTVLWSPLTDGDAPWVWVELFTLVYDETVTDVIAVQQAMSFRAVIDNKAMRIVRNQEFQLVVEQVTLTSAMAINTAVELRVLSGK